MAPATGTGNCPQVAAMIESSMLRQALEFGCDPVLTLWGVDIEINFT